MDQIGQVRVLDGPVRQGPRQPGVVARSRHLDKLAMPLDWVLAAVVGDEPKAAHRVVSRNPMGSTGP